jgi:prepilin-type N-terminal cleavage/methylation domain-containing protein
MISPSYLIKKMDMLIMNKNKGFTLIELLVVMAIIGILASVAVTSYIGSTLKARRSEASSNLLSLRLLEEQFFAENAQYIGIMALPNLVALPGFNPGPGTNFNYAIANNTNVQLPTPVPVPYDGTTVAQPNNCFIVTATGIAGTSVAGDVFAIDCNNNRNF